MAGRVPDILRVEVSRVVVRACLDGLVTDQTGLAVASERRRSDQLGSAASPWTGDGDADDLAVKDHVGADKSLALKHGMPAMEPDGLGDEHKAVARPHLTAKPHVLHAAKRDEALFVHLGLMAEKARKLGGRLRT